MFWMNMLHAEKANWAGYSRRRSPRRRQEVVVNNPEQLTFTLTGAGQQLLVHLQRAVADHPDARTPGTSPPRAAHPTRVAVRRLPTEPPTPSARRSTPSCPSSPATTRPTRRRPTTPCRPTPPTRSGRSSTDRGSCPSFDASGNVTFVPNPTLLGPGQAHAQEVRGAAVHLGLGRVQRTGGRQGRLSVTSPSRTSPSRPTTP